MNLQEIMNKEIEAIFYLTKQCNFKCTYCYKKDQKNIKYLSNSKVKLILDSFLSFNPSSFYLRVRGGEFTMNLDSLSLLEQMFSFLAKLAKKEKSLVFEFSTNMYGLKNNYFYELKKLIDKYKLNKIAKINIDLSIHAEYFPYNNKGKYKLLILNILQMKTIFNEVANLRIVLDNFDLEKYPMIPKIIKNETQMKLKTSNTYGLFLDPGRENYLKFLIDENNYIIYFKDNKELKIPLVKFIKGNK